MINNSTVSVYAIPGLENQIKGASPSVINKVCQIEDEVSQCFGISPSAMKTKSRIRNVCDARHISMFLIRKFTSLSMVETGRRFKRDHSSVSIAVKHVRDLIQTDEAIRVVVKTLERRVE